MKLFALGLLALVLASPFAPAANAQIVVVDHGHRHHHRRYHHHHHYYRH